MNTLFGLRTIAIAVAASLTLAACVATPGRVATDRVGQLTGHQADACVADNVATRDLRTGPACSVPTRSYSSDDIAFTGATTVGTALQRLDPAITVR